MIQGNLEPGEVKTALSGYIREAQSILKQDPIPGERAVHDVRVLMKKSRGAMKLISPAIEVEAFEKEFNSFREVGQITRDWRDTSVHRKTLIYLRREYPTLFTLLSTNSIIQSFLNQPEVPREPSAELKDDIWNIEEILKKAEYRIRFRSLSSLSQEMLLEQVNKTYVTVTDKYIRSRNNIKTDNIHRFRKRAKDLLYQLVFFRSLNPEIVMETEKMLDILTQNLGKYNDLAQLIITLKYKYTGQPGMPSLDELILLIRDEQDKYLAKAWPIAYKIFCPGQKLVNILGSRNLPA
jgi:CHAD domain-containing protein